MTTSPAHGRHRTQSRYNPVSEIAGVLSRAGEHGARASAVLAASGGLVAAFAMPASATPLQQAPKAAPAAAESLAAAPKALASTVLAAPASAAPAARETFGVSGITAVAKPKPKPVVVSTRAVTAASGAVSRSSSRVTLVPAAPAPAPRASASAVVNAARALLGVRYVLGGASMSGMDCSGMTLTAFAAVGISLPHQSESQRRLTTRVSNPVPGDLVFWGSPAWHVGIYSGGGMSIEASTSAGRVVERPLWGSYYFGRL